MLKCYKPRADGVFCLYEHVDTLQFGSAHALAGALLILSFVLLAGVYATHKRYSVLRW